MAWVEPGPDRQYRLRERFEGKTRTIAGKLGIWVGIADNVLNEYRKALAGGYIPQPPVTVAEIREFVKANAQGRDPKALERVIPIEEMADLFLKHYGPSLKGGYSEYSRDPYYHLKCRLAVVKRGLAGKKSDSVTSHDMRDFLTRFATVGSRMRYIGTVGKMFRSFAQWNKEPGIIGFRVAIPPENPVSLWRSQMKPHEKREDPDTRVLSHKEWATLRPHLKPRTLAICEISLARYLRRSDIKALCKERANAEVIRGVQNKTGVVYEVPGIKSHTNNYDFTNFLREFEQAQRASGLWYPVGHPLRFTHRSLRRTGATWALRAGENIVDISKMLGHKNIKTTMRYLHVSEADLSALAGRMDKIVGIKPKRKSRLPDA